MMEVPLIIVLCCIYNIVTSPVVPYSTNGDKVLSMFDLPISLKRTGFYSNSGVGNVGFGGEIYSSMAYSQGYVYDVSFWFDDVGLRSTYLQKSYGASVRCLAK